MIGRLRAYRPIDARDVAAAIVDALAVDSDQSVRVLTHAELVAGKNPELASVPSITRGGCGSDATIAYAQKTDGLVKIVRYVGGAMTGPYDVGGLSKATWVGVGELP